MLFARCNPGSEIAVRAESEGRFAPRLDSGGSCPALACQLEQGTFFFSLPGLRLLQVTAVALGCERETFVGIGDGANAEFGEVEVLRIGRGDLEGVEEEAGSLGVNAVGGECLCDLDERKLDGGGVLKRRQIERCIRQGT